MIRTLTAICAALLAAPALAQDGPASAPLPGPEDIAGRDMVTVALGAGMVPDYEGSDDYRLIPAVGIRGSYKGIGFSTRGLYLYVDVVPDSGSGVGFDAGPIVGVRLNRSQKIKDDFVDALPERKKAFEAGGFVGVSSRGLTNPYDVLSFRVDVIHDFSSAHKSTIFSPNIDFSTPLSRTTFISVGVGAEFVSNRFADYYFSITPPDALVSLLPVYNADGGMKNWKAGLLVNQSLSGDLLHGLSLFGTVQYSRLVGDFADSPIVDNRGSANQWLLAAGLGYTW
ncbi:MAG: MipA/OmpV family protein [Sphingomicrobium sp.]